MKERQSMVFELDETDNLYVTNFGDRVALHFYTPTGEVAINLRPTHMAALEIALNQLSRILRVAETKKVVNSNP